MPKKIVVALGGNALIGDDGVSTAQGQLKIAQFTTKALADLVNKDNQVVIVHGNGPQIGNIILHEESINTDKVPTMPIDVCGAMSQGQIGYWLQNSLARNLIAIGNTTPVASIVTQVEVDANDPAFLNPTKPIGSFYTKEEAEELSAKRGFAIKEDSGRGYRRVIPSPKPINIVEAEFIRRSINADNVIITAGGGGIPVKKEGDVLIGVEAVIDKDFAAAKVAELIDADVLLIVTTLNEVKVNFRQPNEESIYQMDVVKAQEYIDDNQFAPGSMLPKVQAAMEFVSRAPNKKAIITSTDMINQALEGQAGTTITQ